jgi:hypothetical protein
MQFLARKAEVTGQRAPNGEQNHNDHQSARLRNHVAKHIGQTRQFRVAHEQKLSIDSEN